MLILFAISAAVLVFLPSLFLFSQVVAAFFSNTTKEKVEDGHVPVAVLIPAHDEELVIEHTLKALTSQLNEKDSLVVVADNCTDKTAELAKKNGADVLVRIDQHNRGKGYALDAGISYIGEKGIVPEVLIIIDADCQIAPGSISRLANQCLFHDRPVQALDLMRSKENAGISQKVAEFAWVVKNQVRPLGSRQLGMPCQLMGTGMAFPWRLLVEVDFASDEIAEDMKLGIDLSLAGYPPVFDPYALVESFFPETTEAESQQRTRWEHGHLAMITSFGPKLIWSSLVKRDIRLLSLALDLIVPPLAMLVLVSLFSLLFSLLVFFLENSMVPFITSLLGMLLLFFSVLLSWLKWGKNIVTISELAFVPLYTLKKIPVYINFIYSRQKEWVKTDRQQK